MSLTSTLNDKYPQIFEYFFNRFLTEKAQDDFIPNGYQFFTDSGKIGNWGNEYLEYFLDKEKEYNRTYFDNRDYLAHSVFAWYSGYFNHNINSFLRFQNDPSEYSYVTKRIEVIRNEIERFPLKENIVTLRRVANRYLTQTKPGNVILDRGFLSTSLNLSYRMNTEGGYSPINNETVLVIKIPKGQTAIYLEPVSKRDEFELLLPDNLKLHIEAKRKILNNYILLAKVIPA